MYKYFQRGIKWYGQIKGWMNTVIIITRKTTRTTPCKLKSIVSGWSYPECQVQKQSCVLFISDMSCSTTAQYSGAAVGGDFLTSNWWEVAWCGWGDCSVCMCVCLCLCVCLELAGVFRRALHYLIKGQTETVVWYQAYLSDGWTHSHPFACSDNQPPGNSRPKPNFLSHRTKV